MGRGGKKRRGLHPSAVPTTRSAELHAPALAESDLKAISKNRAANSDPVFLPAPEKDLGAEGFYKLIEQEKEAREKKNAEGALDSDFSLEREQKLVLALLSFIDETPEARALLIQELNKEIIALGGRKKLDLAKVDLDKGGDRKIFAYIKSLGYNSKEPSLLAREKRMKSEISARTSQAGLTREELINNLAAHKKGIKIAQSAIAGPGVDSSEISDRTRRAIYHRIDTSLLSEITGDIETRLKGAKKDKYGHVLEKTFDCIIQGAIKKYKKRIEQNCKDNKNKAPTAIEYDLAVEAEGVPTVWELKSSGHIGNKNTELHRLIQNSIILSIITGKTTYPFFACFYEDARFSPLKEIPYHHSLVEEDFLKQFLPKGISYGEYLQAKGPSNEREAAQALKSQAPFAEDSYKGQRVKLLSKERAILQAMLEKERELQKSKPERKGLSGIGERTGR